MNKQEIEYKINNADVDNMTAEQILAGYLQYRGYGDVKRAQIEMLEKLKEILSAKCIVIRNIKDHIEEDMDSEKVFNIINEFIKELSNNNEK